MFRLFWSHRICVFFRSTIKWIKSPLRKWTAWPAEPTALSSGQISAFGLVAFFSFPVSAAVHRYVPLAAFQLWDEVEPGLPTGDVMGVLVLDLHLYQEARRYVDGFLGLIFLIQ